MTQLRRTACGVVLANGHWMNGGVGGTMSITTSPKSSLAKLGLYPKPKPFKIMVLGQSGVGKSALVVRFITRRFIGEYDPNLEKIYAFQTVIDNEMVYFEILDSAGDPHESEYTNLESNIRWAEAFILMYSVTDKCSFDECHRLKFLINYNKRRRRIASSMKWSRGRVASADSEVHPSTLERPLARAVSDTTPEPSALCRRWTEVELDEDEEAGVSRSDSTSSSGQSECAEEFRARASTDSRLPPRPARLRHPPSVRTIPPPVRRMSVAMRGNNARTILFYLLRCHYNSHTAGLLKGLIVYVGFTDMAKVVLANGHWMNGGVGGTMSITTSPKSSLAKLGLYPKPKPFKIMVLGQSGVGKSALVVRFITRRFIGEYDPNLEKIYAFQTVIDNEMVYFEILDSAGDPHESEYTNLESNIRWAEAFILMYSVTDKCSFDECHRLKFLINYNKRRRRIASSMKDCTLETPVVLVGNKADQPGDRMVSTEDGQRRCKEIGCICFHEISVRESIDQVWGVFRDVRRFWRVGSKWSRGRVASADSEVHPSTLERPLARAVSDTTPEPSALCSNSTFQVGAGPRWSSTRTKRPECPEATRPLPQASPSAPKSSEHERARTPACPRAPPDSVTLPVSAPSHHLSGE
ncbi:hypothetical protein MSG28_001627 [Choristoneura fumiferana]|uniref:Uncharacterized protein n=1 Tax=Choristoneura fumiferana TaxID=7141 RepID=A0ACC0KVQ4_CHOFU|nr:hypothetical protein MSG28_001627 [Choristoneura fumiferana]